MSIQGKVIVVGVDEGEITDNGLGSMIFESLEDALMEFPDLDPENPTKRFTKAFPESRDGIIFRFETWAAFNFYSS